ncbi:MAG: hypothetical protein QMD16_16910 [Desulfitobacteriaceae bacterium]|nr:hypothetical protein [Desulfitobacteriaceae bacterium]
MKKPRYSKKALVRLSFDLVFAFMIVLVLWTLNADFIHLGGVHSPKPGETKLTLSLTPGDLALEQWKVLNITLKEKDAIYEVSVGDNDTGTLFKLKVDSANGELLDVETKKKLITGTILTESEVATKVSQQLVSLVPGRVTKKQGETLAKLSLLYGTKTVAIVKINPITAKPVPENTKEFRKINKNESPLISKDLMWTFGILASVFSFVGTLHYWKKGSLFIILKRLRGYHSYLSLSALVFALFHVVDKFPKIVLSTSWLILFLMVAMTLTGFFRRYLRTRSMTQVVWRRVHTQYSILFYSLLAIHILTKVFRGD